MIQSNLLFLIGKALAPDLHGKITFFVSSHFSDFVFEHDDLNGDKLTNNMNF